MARLCATSGLPCGQAGRSAPSMGRDLRRRNPPAVQDKKVSHILIPKVIHREIHRAQRLACGKGVRTTHRTKGFSPAPERPLVSLHRHAERRAGITRQCRRRPGKLAAPKIAAGYHSPVCSSTGDAIDRIAAAIDQLASDARDANGEASEAELTARVATLWQMVSDLDPELARRARRYTGPADGDPSD